MTRILFVCHGNICRSPMAEFVLKDMVRRAGIEQDFYIESAATSTEEIGNPVYPPARKKLAEHNIDCSGKTARRIRREDYENFDLLIGMDEENLYNLHRAYGGDPLDKVHGLLEYDDRHGEEVADPWYTGDFEKTWKDVEAGCRGLLISLVDKVTLDLSKCTGVKEMYGEFRAKMLWGRKYGENLDALWDILTGLPHLGRSFEIIMPDKAAISPDFADYLGRVCRLFLETGLPVEIKGW